MPKSIQERKAELEAELAKVTEQEQREQAERHVILGAVVEKAMEGNIELGRTISELLEINLTKKADRKMFGLTPLPTKRGRPNSEN